MRCEVSVGNRPKGRRKLSGLKEWQVLQTPTSHTDSTTTVQRGLSNTAVSSPSITQRSPPSSSPVASAPSSNTSDSSGASEMATREISHIPKKGQINFSPYPRPNIAEALELRFTERSLMGHHIGRGDAKAVLLPFHSHYGTLAYRFIGRADVPQRY